MAVRREDTPSELKDVQFGCSWLPTTPTKPNSTKKQPICKNLQENHSAQANSYETECNTSVNQAAKANWSEPGRLIEDFLQESLSQRLSLCYGSKNSNGLGSNYFNTLRTGEEATSSSIYEENLRSFDTWQARGDANSDVHSGDLNMYNKFLTDDPDKWANVSFGSLLALAHGVGSTRAENVIAQTGLFARGSTSSYHFRPQNDGGQYKMICGSSWLERKAHVGLNNVPEILTDGSSIPSTPFFDFNTPTGMTTAASSKSMSFQFQPITPDKTNGTEKRASAKQDSSIDTQENNTADQLCATTSTQLQENHKPDNGTTEDPDANKTPQQKKRRKKHRPKVITEEQRKSTLEQSADKPSGPQETTRPKRTYARRKRVHNSANSPLQVETNGTDLDNNVVNSKDIPMGKSKPVRRKRTDKHEDIMDKGTPETADIKTTRRTNSSCKRSLNFKLENQVRDESSSYCQSSNCDMESQEKVDSTDQSTTLHADLLQDDHVFTNQSTRGKCQIVFSNVTHDKEANTVQVLANTNGQQTPKSLNGSICSNTCSTPEINARGLKRQHIGTTIEAELCYKNANGTFYNSMQAYSSIFVENVDSNNSPPGMHLPAIYKKKRTDNVHNTSISSLHYAVTASDNQVKLEREPLRNSCAELFKSRANQGSSVAQSEYTNLLSSTPAADGFHIQNEPELFVSMLPSVPAERIKKKRTKGPTRVCNSDSPLEICKELPASLNRAATSYRLKHGTEIPHEPHTCMQPLVADTCSTMKKTKQSRRNMHINLTVQNMYNDQEFASKSMGPQLAVTWEHASPVESVVEQLKRLDLSAETSQASLQEHNAFMAYHMKYQDFSTLVPYQRVGTVVPFDSSFYQVRRRKPRPKVDLDDETTRVWKLLLENINSEGIDGTDEEKAQWWEEERRIFTGRADSFIARMHLVQGDRRFSPWKGSVIDSVIGVFLTQNVSDHLSSSAFMSLAARFPLQSKPNLAELKEEKVDTTPEASVLDPDESFELRKEVLKKPVCGEGAKITQDREDNETIGNSVRPSANIVKPSGLNYDISVPKDGLGVQFPDIYKQYSVMSHESTVENSTNLIEDAGDIDEALSSQTSVISSQNSAGSQVALNIERTESCSQSTSEEPNSMAETKRCTSSTSFMKLLQMAGTILRGVHENSQEKESTGQTESLRPQNEGDYEDSIYLTKPVKSCNKSVCLAPISEQQPAQCFDLSEENSNFSYSSSIKGFCTTEISTLSVESESQTTFQKSATATFEEAQKTNTSSHSSNYWQNKINQKVEDNQTGKVPSQILLQEINYRMQEVSHVPGRPQNLMSNTGTSGNIDNLRNSEHKEVKANNNDPGYPSSKMVNEPKARGIIAKEKQNSVDWDNLRKQAQAGDTKTERTANTMDSVDWDAVRCADVNEIADTIKERGMNNKLAERIKDFLDRVVREHGSIDLEWLRDVPPDKAKEYLLSFRGLGLKSVECVRLLTLHHLAFPVDTNVGRIAVRLGWVPLQTLPESLQLHLLELYPILESIQKYLWPRLCKLDQKTLYELHYQMITFGKVFCTKSKPNCNACPMRGECRHFASAFASARLALPAPQDKSIALATENFATDQIPLRSMNTLHLPSPEANQRDATSGISNSQPIIEEPATPEPIIEEPPSPETAYEDPNEIPTIQLNMDEFTHNLQKIMQQNTELQEGDMSKALVALTSEAASIPVPKLKNVSQLRTEHQVYELPDSHPLLEEMDKREPDDPCPYLLAIWTPGETVDSIESPRRMCSSQESEKLCTKETCLSCNCLREANSQTIRGTLLIPCRTAMRGSFPLNGTYFQVNEVFADHESSLAPMDVPREWLWNLPRRTVYFGTSIPTIFKGLSTEGIQYCFWRGFVCVRGFDRRTRAPRPLIARLHFPASKREKKNI